MEESKEKSQKLDHITEIIGIFGPFHGFWYTVLGETYSFLDTLVCFTAVKTNL